jgi:hypothetical protein
LVPPPSVSPSALFPLLKHSLAKSNDVIIISTVVCAVCVVCVVCVACGRCVVCKESKRS